MLKLGRDIGWGCRCSTLWPDHVDLAVGTLSMKILSGQLKRFVW